MSETGIVVDEKQAELAFDDGFKTETPPPKTAAVVAEPPKTEPKPEPVVPKVEPKPAAKVAPKVETPAPKPKYVQITEEQFARLEATASKTVEIEKQISKLFGTTGDMQQIVKTLQTQTPSGQRIELPEKFLAKTRKDFPELADQIEDDMREALKGLRGTGPAQAPVTDPSAVQKQVEAAFTNREIKTLSKKYPDWRDIVGAVDSYDKRDPTNPFRVWLAKQPVEYQTEVNDADDATTISEAIDKFKASKAKPDTTQIPSPKDAAATERKKILAAAVTPKGDGGQPPPPKTVEDAFAEGFNSR